MDKGEIIFVVLQKLVGRHNVKKKSLYRKHV